MKSHVPLLLPAALLAVGIMGGTASGWPGAVWLGLLVATAAGAGLTMRWGRVNSLLVLVATGALGGWIGQRAEQATKPTLPLEKVVYAAVVCSEPVERGKVVNFDMAVITGGSPWMVKAKLLRDTLAEARYKRLHVGDGLQAESYLDAPITFPSSTFDYARWLRRHGFVAETLILPDDWQKARVALKPLGWWTRAAVQARKVRQELSARYVEAKLGGEEAAVVTALTLGDKGKLSKDLKDTYSLAGAAHVLALSGLHLGILCTLFTLFQRQQRRKRWWPTLLLLTAVWSFAFLTGLSPSVVRAAAMLSIYTLIGLLGRDPQPLNTLLATMIILLVVQPLWIYDTGFLLSVTAVASILLFLPLLRLATPNQVHSLSGRIGHGVWAFVCVSVAAQLGTAPLVAFSFGRLPVYFLLANAIAVPCATVIIYGVVLLWMATPLPAVQPWLAKGVGTVAHGMNEGLRWVAGLPGASVDHLHPSALQTALCYLLLLILWGICKRIQLVRMQAKRVNGD